MMRSSVEGPVFVDPVRGTSPKLSDRLREGFRMPARRERWPGKKAGVRKPPKNEPAGQWGEDLAVYGDLARQRVCRGMVLLGSLRAEGR